jgi:hypothetical protein
VVTGEAGLLKHVSYHRIAAGDDGVILNGASAPGMSPVNVVRLTEDQACEVIAWVMSDAKAWTAQDVKRLVGGFSPSLLGVWLQFCDGLIEDIFRKNPMRR